MKLIACVWPFESLVGESVEMRGDERILFRVRHLLVNKFVRMRAFGVVQVAGD